MKLDILSEEKDGLVVHRRYSCPCGQGYIDEEQDYTSGHRDAFVTIQCPKCREHYSVIYSESGLRWKLYHDYTTYYNKRLTPGGMKMARRSPYSKVNKTNQIRAEHVKGMGDVVFKGFQCLNPECTEYTTLEVYTKYGIVSQNLTFMFESL